MISRWDPNDIVVNPERADEYRDFSERMAATRSVYLSGIRRWRLVEWGVLGLFAIGLLIFLLLSPSRGMPTVTAVIGFVFALVLVWVVRYLRGRWVDKPFVTEFSAQQRERSQCDGVSWISGTVLAGYEVDASVSPAEVWRAAVLLRNRRDRAQFLARQRRADVASSVGLVDDGEEKQQLDDLERRARKILNPHSAEWSIG